jgi:hypothetical protein
MFWIVSGVSVYKKKSDRASWRDGGVIPLRAVRAEAGVIDRWS